MIPVCYTILREQGAAGNADAVEVSADKPTADP